jgi:hypothetical protein
MKSNIAGGTLNRNQAGARETRPQPVASREDVGYSAPNVAGVGATDQPAARPRSQDAPRDHRASDGGQTTLGRYPGVRRWATPAPTKAEEAVSAARSQAAPAQAVQAPAKPFSCRQPRSRIAGLSYGKYRVIEEGVKAEDAHKAKMKAALAPVAAAPVSSAPLTVPLTRERFTLFERTATREQRPVGDVIAEWLDRAAKRLTKEEAMHRAAAASDAYERRGYVPDEEAEFAHRSAGAGYVEVQLALVG